MAKDVKVNIEYLSKYKKASANGATTVFVYGISGSESAIEAYKKSCEDAGFPAKVDDESGKLMYFSTRYHNAKNQLTISGFSGKTFVEDNTSDIMNSVLEQQTNADVRTALAGEIAKNLLANALGGGTSSSAPAQAEATVESTVEASEEEAEM